MSARRNLPHEFSHLKVMRSARAESQILKECLKVYFSFIPLIISVTRSWKYHDHSYRPAPDKDFKKMNALCVKKKVVRTNVREWHGIFMISRKFVRREIRRILKSIREKERKAWISLCLVLNLNMESPPENPHRLRGLFTMSSEMRQHMRQWKDMIWLSHWYGYYP